MQALCLFDRGVACGKYWYTFLVFCRSADEIARCICETIDLSFSTVESSYLVVSTITGHRSLYVTGD
eukprot:SAG31_NODE_45734_length_257_cov_1.278481_1_plen_66_part_10